MRRWLVGGALIRHDDGLVLVCNRRRDNSVEWTPPGGVIDHGETLLVGLAREVFEETGLVVNSWTDRCYTVTVEAPDMGWVMTVEAWETEQVSGEICIADPDGIVEEVRHSSAAHAVELLTASSAGAAASRSERAAGVPWSGWSRAAGADGSAMRADADFAVR